MATGVKMFDSTGQSVKRDVPLPPPQPKVYQFKLKADGVAVEQTDSKKPYITGLRLELSGTSPVEGGRNRSIKHSLWLDLDPAKAGGTADALKGTGPVALARALGEELQLPEAEVMVEGDDGDMKPVRVIDARALKAWLQARDGRTGEVKTRIKTFNEIKYGAVDFFVEKESGGGDAAMANEPEISIG